MPVFGEHSITRFGLEPIPKRAKHSRFEALFFKSGALGSNTSEP
jgi:hypothetical protein